jgi:hypothetical protein
MGRTRQGDHGVDLHAPRRDGVEREVTRRSELPANLGRIELVAEDLEESNRFGVLLVCAADARRARNVHEIRVSVGVGELEPEPPRREVIEGESHLLSD